MKPTLLLLVLLAAPFESGAQAPPPTVLSKGPHHRTWGQIQEIQTPRGPIARTNVAFVELATGLHYRSGDQWLESQEVIEVLPEGGAAAQRGQIQVLFPGNIKDGVITLVTPDQRRFVSRTLGLAYYCTATRKSVLISELQSSTGLVVPPNQALYPNAFTDVEADLRITYRFGSCQADVVIRSRPLLSPELCGLNPATCQMQVWHEWFEAPEARLETHVLRPETGFAGQTVEFGSVRFGEGRAFALPGESALEASALESVPVAKEWTSLPDPETGLPRQFLIESVEYPSIKPLLDTLPSEGASLSGTNKTARTAAVNRKPAASRAQFLASLPKTERRDEHKGSSREIRMAQISSPQIAALNARRGVVLDYVTLNSSQTNIVFASDTTFYVTAPVYLSGTNFLEAAVIKFAKTNSPSLNFTASGAWLVCLTTNYRPAILTSVDDDTVGTTLPSSTGNPSGYAAATAINLCTYGTSPIFDFHHVAIRYAQWAVQAAYSTSCHLRHAQVLNCSNAFYGYNVTFTLRNALLNSVSNIFSGSSSTLVAEHATVDQAITLNTTGSTNMYLTNCLLANVGSASGYVGANNESVSSDAFQTVGAGAHYLSPNSGYRDCGTTNVNPHLLAELRQLTTYPPIVASNAITVDTVFSPQAARDTDLPDLGFHFSPIDFAVNTLSVSNAVLLLTNGVTVATFGDHGLWVHDGAQLISDGSPLQRNHLCRYICVQELATNWGNGNVSSFNTIIPWSYDTHPTGRFRFTDFDTLAGSGSHLYHSSEGSQWAALAVRDCEFAAGSVYLTADLPDSFTTFTNNLFYRSQIEVTTLGAFLAYHNLFKDAYCFLYEEGTNTWLLRDNVFDAGTLFCLSDLTNSHTAYINIGDRLSPTNSTDKILTSLAWEAGPLGRYYQPTNSSLINAGSQYATNAGLYHFTTTTNQVKEGTTTADIGYHYVAVTNVAGVWVAIDTDGDGWPDYMEDANGNGSVNSAETDWTSASDPGLKVWIVKPKSGSCLP